MAGTPISTSVVESGNGPSSLMDAKFGDNPGEDAKRNNGDVVRLPSRLHPHARWKANAPKSKTHVVPLLGGSFPTTSSATPKATSVGHLSRGLHLKD